jgi:hypothetical protein
MLEQLQEDPIFRQNMQNIEKQTKSFIANDQRENGIIITIPVVVHVVYKTNAQNISDSQIQTQMDVLTDDFRRMNSDADNTWSQASDTEIEFCLATVDPSGNATSGIQRRKTNKPSFSANDAMKKQNTGGLSAWPSSDYLNVWVCNLSGGLLGYAQFPGGQSSTDGVVVDYQYFGTTGTATAPYDLGRTATHEVGHWLNLRHSWGDGGCSVDDFVSDTPLSDASNGGCAVGHVSCGTVDMVQNYMDYSYDDCMNLFTAGQSNRMNALFGPGGARESLLSSGGCGNGGNSPTCLDGIMNGNETGVDCGGPDCNPCGGGGTCEVPTGQLATNIKPKKAKLNWSSVSGANSYSVQVAVAGTTNWSTFTTSQTSLTASGLSNGTSYDWRVEADCGSSTSGYSGICNFQAGNSGSGDCAARLIQQFETDFSLFPNPTYSIIHLTDIDPANVSKVEILDFSGQVINSNNAENAMRGISTESFDAGMYIMKVTFTNNDFTVKRFIKID